MIFGVEGGRSPSQILDLTSLRTRGPRSGDYGSSVTAESKGLRQCQWSREKLRGSGCRDPIYPDTPGTSLYLPEELTTPSFRS